ncbi:hypothetical protein HZB02_06740 [Candidatus Woesearchaeota archaeon]|nr:hypothetical protein [Candidatus Woesearchaeota archaeon]
MNPLAKRFLVKTALYLTIMPSVMLFSVRNAEHIRGAYHALIYGRIPVAEQSYGDLYGLKFERMVNEEGERAMYLVDIYSKERKMIGKDLLTGTPEQMVQGLEKRLVQHADRAIEQQMYAWGAEQLRRYPLNIEEKKEWKKIHDLYQPLFEEQSSLWGKLGW